MAEKLVAMTFQEASRWIASQDARIRELEAALAVKDRILERHVRWRDKALRYLKMVRDRADGYRPLIENFIEASELKIIQADSPSSDTVDP